MDTSNCSDSYQVLITLICTPICALSLGFSIVVHSKPFTTFLCKLPSNCQNQVLLESWYKCSLLVSCYGPVLCLGLDSQMVMYATGPYHGGVWKIRVELPDAYPYKSPSVGFVNKIYHPNVDEM